MQTRAKPRPFPEWRPKQSDREEDAAYTFGYHLIKYCRDEAMATVPIVASSDMKAAVEKAVDTALHNVNDMLEGFWKLKAGPEHTVELALKINVFDMEQKFVEAQEISPCKQDLPIGYWKWALDRDFQ